MITASIINEEIIIRTPQNSAVKIIKNGNTYYAKRNSKDFYFYDSDDFFSDVLDILGEKNYLTFPIPIFNLDFVHFDCKDFNYFHLIVSRNANDELYFEFATREAFITETFLTIVLNKKEDFELFNDHLFNFFSYSKLSKNYLWGFFDYKLKNIVEKANKAFEEYEKNYRLGQNEQILSDIKKWTKRQLYKFIKTDYLLD